MPRIGERGEPPAKRAVRKKPATSRGGGFAPTPDQQDRTRVASRPSAPPQPGPVRPGDTAKIRQSRGTVRRAVRRTYEEQPAAKRQEQTRKIARKRQSGQRLTEAERTIESVHNQRHAADVRVIHATGLLPRAVYNDGGRVMKHNRMPAGAMSHAEAYVAAHPELTAGGRKAILAHPDLTDPDSKRFKAGGSGPLDQLKKELEGKGVIADLASKAGTAAGAAMSLATHPVRASASAPGIRSAKASAVPTDLAGRAAKDLVNAPAQVIPSVYVPAAGAVEAAQGRPERLKAFLGDLDKSDPIYNTVAAGVEAIGGDSEAAKKRLDAAWNAAKEHPGFTALEVIGAKGAIGRGTGRVMRSGVVGEGAKKAASTEREPLRMPGTNITAHREYSPDVFTSAGQKLTERNRRGRAERALEEARHVEEDNPQRAAELRAEAERLYPTHVREQDIQRRVDEHVDAEERVRRQHRSDVLHETDRITKPVKDAGPILNLVARGIARADVGDLRDYVHELEAEFGGLSNAGKRANKQLRAGIEKAIDKAEKGKVDLHAVERAAEQYREHQAPREAALAESEMLPQSQAERAAVMPYAVRRMGAEHVKARWVDGDGATIPDTEVRSVRAQDPQLADSLYSRVPEHLADAKGEPLSLADIKAHMEAHGQKPPAFLSQAPNARGASNYFRSSTRPPSISRERLTGKATKGGTFDAHMDTLREQAARQQGLVDAHEGWTNYLHEFGYRGRNGELRTVKTKREADEAIRDAAFDHNGDPIPGAVKWRAVRVNPYAGTAEQLQRMLEGRPEDAHWASRAVNVAIERALDSNTEGSGPWALVPDVAARRLEQHVRMMNPDNAGRIARKGQTVFRKTVLATSLPWLAGNVVEGVGRAALAHAGPRSYIAGRKVLSRAHEIDKDRGERLAARTIGGGHLSSVKANEVHFDSNALDPGKVQTVAHALTAFWKAPGPKQAAALWHAYTHVVFDLVNHPIEKALQTAMLGKAMRDHGLMDRHTLKVSEDAIDRAAHGALDVNTAAELGRAVDRMYGRYSKSSPSERKAIALYTPFIAWTRNSAYFVLRTLPRDHPVALTVIAATENATDEWRRDHGLDLFMKGGLPDWLQGSIPLPGGGHVRPGRYTPLGAFSDPLDTAAGLVLPGADGILMAGKGLDWTGNRLPDQSPAGKGKAAVEAFMGGSIPFLSLGQRIAAKGPEAAIVDATLTKVPPAKKKATRRTSSSKSGSGSGAGFVNPGGSGSGAGFVGQ